MIYFKIKLQFKFRKNKIYSYVIVNFQTSLCYKIHYMKNKNYPEKRTAGWYIVISVLLQPLKQYFTDVTSFRPLKSLYSLPVPFKHRNNFGSVFTNHLDFRISETKFLSHVGFLFFCFIFLV
jgi:hypothetical protein